MLWKRAVLYCLLPSAIALLAAGTPCAAFSADIVAPSVGPVKVEPGEEVKFEAIAQDDWGQDLTAETKWTWDFGDGEQSNQNPVWHVFKSGGSFTVTVTGSCAGQEGSDRIICQQFPEGVVWSLCCKIQIIGQPDPDVEPGGDVCHTCEVYVRHEGDLGDWKMSDEVDYWHKEGDGEWDECEREEEDYIVWDTLENKNEPVHWKAQVHLGIWDDVEEEWDPEVHFWVGPETWNVKNTVVSSGNDVLLWDPEDPEGSEVTISWDIVHSEVIDPEFSVEIEICNLCGTVERTFSVPGPIGVGEGSVDWDGLVEDEEENLVTAEKGVYSYKVFANDEEECHDADKSGALRITGPFGTGAPTLANFQFDRRAMTVETDLEYHLSSDAAECHCMAYDRNLTVRAAKYGAPTAQGNNVVHMGPFPLLPTVLGELSFVLFAEESAEVAQGDRGAAAKYAEQRGTITEVKPQAYDFMGVATLDLGTHGIIGQAEEQQEHAPQGAAYPPPPYDAFGDERNNLPVKSIYDRLNDVLPNTQDPNPTEDAIVFYAGHGMPDRLLVHAAQGRDEIRGGWASSPPNDPEHRIYYLCNLEPDSLTRCALAFLLGCRTAATDAQGNNLMDALGGLGADARVGFTQDIFTPQANLFSERFWEYTMRDRKTISAALGDAYDDVDGAGGISSLFSTGALGERLRPGIYGE